MQSQDLLTGRRYRAKYHHTLNEVVILLFEYLKKHSDVY